MMYQEEWGEIVIDWLVKDYALKKKARRNNKNIFEGLQIPAENQECFLEGLKMLFNQTGSVPRKLRLDKLAVVKVRGHGQENVFNEEFLRFASHNGFEAQPVMQEQEMKKGM